MKEKNKDLPEEMMIYQSPDGGIKIEVFFKGDTLWLNLNKIADLFGTSKQNVSYHLKNIFSEKELDKGATVKEILTVQNEGGRKIERSLEYYNFDAIISTGYRINSERATQFRIWATKVLKEYIIKGFALDDERLKSGKSLKESYFTELIERIRDIRTSERLFYQKITDIYATSIDYDSKSEATKDFYASVQNKLHWAIHGHTAAELIVERVSSVKTSMGLTSWKNAPAGKIRRSDVSIAKNYLDEQELRKLNRFVTMYLDYAENQAEEEQAMTMKDWTVKLDAFLHFNKKDILTNFGKVSTEVAKQLAEKEFEKYDEKNRKIEATTSVSDFDKLIAESRLLEGGSNGKIVPQAPDKKNVKRKK